MHSVAGKHFVRTKAGQPGKVRHTATGERFATANTPAAIHTLCGLALQNAQEADGSERYCKGCERSHAEVPR